VRPERVLVTGASRGIGRAVAERLLNEGRTVVLVARARDRLSEVAKSAPSRAHVFVADLATETNVVAAACGACGGLDALVHAAGIARHAALDAIADADFVDSVALHMRAPLYMMQELAAHLRTERRGGSIVNVASTLAMRPAPGTLVYSATKAALVAMTRAAALELAPFGIRVNAVAPGIVDTDMIRGRDRAELAQLHPLGRIGTAAEVADAIVYLLDAEWVTGSVLTIDGGLGIRQ
jgi:NAD(P)-dependent dehydrogenase (short-subunit alcohol dehydrogenase family)